MKRLPFISWLLAVALFLVAVISGWLRTEHTSAKALRVGFFPNVTHAQAIIAQQMAFEGQDWYASRLPENLPVAWYPFNAGPSVMEALIIGTTEISYVGPNPALNAYVRTKGREIRQLAGSAQGGSALVVQAELSSKSPKDFIGKTIATPQFGNTQDVACRSWLIKGGLNIIITGGDANVLPIQNPDMVQSFGQKNIDAAWTVEPWVSRLERNFQGKIVLEQPKDITTILTTSERSMQSKPEIIQAFAKAHHELTLWIQAHPAEATNYLHRGLERITRTKLDPDLIAAAFRRIHFTDSIDRPATQRFVDDAYAIGMLADNPNLDRFFQHARQP